MKATFKVKHDNKVYEQPFCRIKIDSHGGISILIYKDCNWHGVKGEIIDFEFIEKNHEQTPI